MDAQSPSNRWIHTEELNQASFAAFGEVIQNPATYTGLDSSGRTRPLEQISANQGSATKWVDVSRLENGYGLAPSRKPARAVVNVFVCKPRDLVEKEERTVFPVTVLERHPFTSQTFIPLGLSARDSETRYLVIVAPTLRPTSRQPMERLQTNKPYPAEKPRGSRLSFKDRLLGARPNPFTNDYAPTTTPSSATPRRERKPKGTGPPDLNRLRAFLARGDQAVTYGPGTWHAPMAVLGEQDITFVVVQYANGVELEDCQQCSLDANLILPPCFDHALIQASAPGIMRSKL